eukprot:TRINITY_DN8814_c0_g1_i1.p1 TRINITY_DN8814_c0_g1~~TRINITY_DN8814_c0_g1_i1.p1  ORF type:complete len:157 (-),score=32.06 TRINITY_DN8814_c0_g1_i1:45-515(-)
MSFSQVTPSDVNGPARRPISGNLDWVVMLSNFNPDISNVMQNTILIFTWDVAIAEGSALAAMRDSGCVRDVRERAKDIAAAAVDFAAETTQNCPGARFVLVSTDETEIKAFATAVANREHLDRVGFLFTNYAFFLDLETIELQGLLQHVFARTAAQ